MYNVVILNKPLWLRSKARLSGKDNEDKANALKTTNLTQYRATNKNDWCLCARIKAEADLTLWLALNQLILAVRDAKVHILNPELLVQLIRNSEMEKSDNQINKLVEAIQLGDYKAAESTSPVV